MACQTLAQQRHVQLLGRSVDLTHRVSGAMNKKITEVRRNTFRPSTVNCGRGVCEGAGYNVGDNVDGVSKALIYSSGTFGSSASSRTWSLL